MNKRRLALAAGALAPALAVTLGSAGPMASSAGPMAGNYAPPPALINV